MEFNYGKGLFVEGSKKIEGQIALGEHKLYLKDENGELAQTYIPLEKIEKLVRSGDVVTIHVRPSLAYRYIVSLKGVRQKIVELVRDLVSRRGLKKKFLRNEWVEEEQ